MCALGSEQACLRRRQEGGCSYAFPGLETSWVDWFCRGVLFPTYISQILSLHKSPRNCVVIPIPVFASDVQTFYIF